MKATIKIEYEYPDWQIEIYVDGKEWGSGFFASLAEGMIHAYNELAKAFDIPFSFDGCPEHHPRVKAERGETHD